MAFNRLNIADGLNLNADSFRGGFKDFKSMTIAYHAQVAKQYLAFRQKEGMLQSPNMFIDGRPGGKPYIDEHKTKFGGRIVYSAIRSLTELMDFLDMAIFERMPYRTGLLEHSHHWRLNGKPVSAESTVQSFGYKDQLIAMAGVPYAKYVEVGTKRTAYTTAIWKRKSGKSVNTGRVRRVSGGAWMYKKAVQDAKRKFGDEFIIEHKMIQTSYITPEYAKGRNKKGKPYTKFTDAYYKKRWAVSQPGIKVTLRQGVSYKN